MLCCVAFRWPVVVAQPSQQQLCCMSLNGPYENNLSLRICFFQLSTHLKQIKISFWNLPDLTYSLLISHVFVWECDSHSHFFPSFIPTSGTLLFPPVWCSLSLSLFLLIPWTILFLSSALHPPHMNPSVHHPSVWAVRRLPQLWNIPLHLNAH